MPRVGVVAANEAMARSDPRLLKEDPWRRASPMWGSNVTLTLTPLIPIYRTMCELNTL
jgi:hypothetical protein